MAGRDLLAARAVRKGRNLLADRAPVPDERGVLTRAVSNAPASASNFARSIYEAVRHPVQTGEVLKDVFVGGVQNALPEALQAASAAEQRAKASAVGGYFKNRYGSLEGVKETIANDPVGFLADASIPLTGGGAAIAKVPALTKVGGAISTVGSAIDPINVAGKVVAPVAKAGGSLAANAVGGMLTHTGGESVKRAFTSGLEGGEAGRTFRENMRGAAPATQVVDDARAAVANLREQRSKAYRAGMTGVSKDQTVLDMQPIVDELNAQAAKGQYKGQTIDPSTAQVRQQINDAVVEWWQLDPKQFHTPEGLDALKQKIWDIREATEYGSRARTVADGVYNSVKATITKQAPGYAKVMKDYENASEALREVERALSLGDKGRITADTALRKLQSILRNNANTNYGARVKSAQQLEQAGATNLMPALAGQAMNTLAPRGLGGVVAGGVGGAGVLTLNPLAIPLLAAQSPRIVGETVHAAGRVGGPLGNALNTYARPAATPAYEAGQARRNALVR